MLNWQLNGVFQFQWHIQQHWLCSVVNTFCYCFSCLLRYVQIVVDISLSKIFILGLMPLAANWSYILLQTVFISVTSAFYTYHDNCIGRSTIFSDAVGLMHKGKGQLDPSTLYLPYFFVHKDHIHLVSSVFLFNFNDLLCVESWLISVFFTCLNLCFWPQILGGVWRYCWW